LDALEQVLTYLPLGTPHMTRAAEIWAQARRSGLSTADDKTLDADVILAAQAASVGGVIATENVAHLSRFAQAHPWKDVTLALLQQS
jgi:predicted nucleic acid-binding protein